MGIAPETLNGTHDLGLHSTNARLAFSLFYFGSDAGAAGADKYRLLLEGAKYADQNGFSAVWTPERHFHTVGGLYPNPSLTSAALAMITQKIQIRAGSVVLPLHNPIRVAEEWAVVDNLSNGRTGVSFASGWHANDFAFVPANFGRRKEAMLEGIETFRKLWRGESIPATSGSGMPIEVQIFPKPIQKELPLWLTSSGNADTFQAAGEMGVNVLTHLFGQAADSLPKKIALYREAWQKAGHPGQGSVGVMMHTFLWGDTEGARLKVRGPLREYLRTYMDLSKKAQGPGAEKKPAETPSKEDFELLLDNAADRYFESSGLFGTPAHGMKMIQKLTAMGIDEIACLIDFGVDTDSVLASLPYLNELRQLATSKPMNPIENSIPSDPARMDKALERARRQREAMARRKQAAEVAV